MVGIEGSPKPRIFISYRRDDDPHAAGRLHDALSRHFGAGQVFVDTDDVPLGTDFVEAIQDAVSSCDVLLALIGKQWLTIRDSRKRRRLDDALDYVRLELATALQRDIPVIPVLTQGARVPSEQSLPDDLKKLARRNATELSHATWASDVGRLIQDLERRFSPRDPESRTDSFEPLAAPAGTRRPGGTDLVIDSPLPTREADVAPADDARGGRGGNAPGRWTWATRWGAAFIGGGALVLGLLALEPERWAPQSPASTAASATASRGDAWPTPALGPTPSVVVAGEVVPTSPATMPVLPTGSPAAAQASPAALPKAGWTVLVSDWRTPDGQPDRLARPGKVAVDGQGNVYVADQGNDRVVKFGPDGQILDEWSSRRNNRYQFKSPGGVAVDGRGNVYVADPGNERVVKLGPDGWLIGDWRSDDPNSGPFAFPADVAVDGQGNVYVVEFRAHRTRKLGSDGTTIKVWGSLGSENGQFSHPRGVAVDGRGNVYVADTANHRIQQFDSDGSFLATWPGDSGQFKSPSDVAVDGQGNLYVADSETHRVVKLGPDGAPSNAWGGLGGSPEQFNSPQGVAVDGQGNLYVADQDNHRVQRLTP